MKFLVILMPILLAVVAHGASASTDPAQSGCPAQITIDQQVIDRIDGWEPISSKKAHPLTSVSLFRGHPSALAELAPSHERRARKQWTATWRLDPEIGPYWIECRYAEATAAVARPLPSDKKSCTAIYDATVSEPVIKRWHCATSDFKAAKP